MTLPSAQPDDGRSRRLLLGALIVTFVLASACVLRLLAYQKAGLDFSSFWVGAKTALSQPARLYDFDYITSQLGWPLGPGKLRPYVSPPSALLLFAPFALAPLWLAYALWVLLSAGTFLWAVLRARLPWWSILLPPVAWVAYCGQTTLLIGGLALGGLAMRRRPILAGVLFGVAAAVKPQLLVLLPIALIADRAGRRSWRPARPAPVWSPLRRRSGALTHGVSGSPPWDGSSRSSSTIRAWSPTA
jgi:hypothetical protein